MVDLSRKELERYSLAKALLDYSEGRWGDGTFEREVSDAIAAEGKRPAQGLYVPLGLPTGERAGLDTATATKGAELKFVGPGPTLIDLLRSISAVLRLGATFLPGLTDNITFVRQTAAGGATWMQENSLADVGQVDASLDTVPLTPKTLMTAMAVSRQLLIQSSYATRITAEYLLRRSLARDFATALDKAAIQGPGGLQPTGILNAAGVTVVALGANGAQPVYDNWVELENQLGSANADYGALGYLTTPTIRKRARLAAQIAGTTGVPVWYQGEVLDYPAAASTNCPANLTKGTSTTCCPIVFGNWEDLIIGEWGSGLDIVVDQFAKKKQGMLELAAFMMTDVELGHAASFAVIKDALP